MKGAVGSGKTSLLQERCIFLSKSLAGIETHSSFGDYLHNATNEKLGVPAASVLILLADMAQLDRWNTAMSEKTSTRFKCHTFSSFIREELTVFYPLALANCQDIVQKEIKPVFLAPEASIHLISKVVQARREKDGLFAALVSSNQRIAAVLSNNLKVAALEGIPAEEIGSRLYEALDRKDTVKERIFKDMDEIGLAYRKKCLELGVLDSGMAVEIYRKFLLKDELYRQSLCKRYRHLIIDDLQETSHVMQELATILINSCDTAFLAYDPEFGSAELLHGNRRILESKIYKACKIAELEKASKSTLGEALYSAILNDGAAIIKSGFGIERFPAAELRSEMLEQLAYKVCSLINDDGFRPSDIVVLSTYGDIVTELVIGNILGKNGIKFINTGARQNAADSPLCSGLLAFARLCHPNYRLFPDRGAVKQLIELLFGLDPVRSSKIARKTCSTFPFPQLPDLEGTISNVARIGNAKGKYDYVSNWISNYKKEEKPINISKFLQLSLMEIFLDRATAEEEILKAKQLIDSADKFCNVTVKFGRNAGRDFIEMAESILKSDEGWVQPEEAINAGGVLLTTPEAYILSSGYNKVLIISGLSSRHWSRNRGRELSNPRVLSASWDRGMKYTQEMEEKDSRQYLASMMRAVMEKGSSRIMAFESLLSENGFENDGILPEILDTIRFTDTTVLVSK